MEKSIGLNKERAASSNFKAALEDHLQRRQKQISHDENMLNLVRTGLDVPVSHIQGKSHQGIFQIH